MLTGPETELDRALGQIFQLLGGTNPNTLRTEGPGASRAAAASLKPGEPAPDAEFGMNRETLLRALQGIFGDLDGTKVAPRRIPPMPPNYPPVADATPQLPPQQTPGVLEILQAVLGTNEGASAIGTMDWANGAAPPPEMNTGRAGAVVPVPIPKARPDDLQRKPAVPGNQRIPIPTARPTGMENAIAGVRTLAGYGPSVAPSQEGTMTSPSQGPGEAITEPEAVSKMPGIMEAIQRMTGGNSAPSAPRAPVPPSPNRMAPGQLRALIGGQNPLAQQRAPVIAMLSRLLGGR